MKKMLLTLGSATAALAPITTVVACGSDAGVVINMEKSFTFSHMQTLFKAMLQDAANGGSTINIGSDRWTIKTSSSIVEITKESEIGIAITKNGEDSEKDEFVAALLAFANELDTLTLREEFVYFDGDSGFNSTDKVSSDPAGMTHVQHKGIVMEMTYLSDADGAENQEGKIYV